MLGAVVGGGANSAACVELVSALAETLLAEMRLRGGVTAADIVADTRSESMMREIISSNSVIVGRSEIAAWSRV